MSSATIHRWLSSVYPTLQLDQEWLSECINYLTAHRQDLMGAALLKTIEQQILLSPLEACTSAGSIPDEVQEMEDGTLSPGKGVLVQIISLDEVGHAAVGLREVLHSQKEEARLGQEAANRVRVHGLTQEGVDGDEAAGQVTRYPRTMLKLQLSDGHTVLNAIEYKHLPALNLADTALGAKILLKNARVRRGTVLLEPNTAIVKGRSFVVGPKGNTNSKSCTNRWFYTRAQRQPE